MYVFRYYQLMEQLQENLEEYDKLQQLASELFPHSVVLECLFYCLS